MSEYILYFGVLYPFENKINKYMNKENLEQELQDENLTDNETVTNEQQSVEVEADVADNVTDWEEKYNQLNDTYLRLNAEFDNYRKRTLKEKAELLKMGSERVLQDVITVVDDFERALENIAKANDVEAITEGVELIHGKFVNFLTKNSVQEVETIGQPFDVDKHEAVTMVPATNEEDKGKVIDCIQKGYTLGDKVIRFPKVIVAK